MSKKNSQTKIDIPVIKEDISEVIQQVVLKAESASDRLYKAYGLDPDSIGKQEV